MRRSVPALRVAFVAACLTVPLTTPAHAATKYVLVSVETSPGARNTYYPITAISGDGRWVAYVAGTSGGLVPADAEVSPPADSALYLQDVTTGRQTKVMNGSCCISSLSLSRDGRYLVFDSWLENVVPGDSNKSTDVFVYDRVAKRTTRMVNVRGGQLEKGAQAGVVTPDGSTVVYVSSSDVFVKRNQQAPPCEIYKYSLRTRKTTAVLVGGNAVCSFPAQLAASTNGRYLAVATTDALVREDTGASVDVYWIDTVTHRAVMASAPPPSGTSTAEEVSQLPTIDGAGRLVGFVSGTSSLFALQSDEKVMLRDIPSGRLVDVSYGLLGSGATDTIQPRLSENGRWFTFTDNHGELTGAYHYDLRAVYVRDLTKDVSTTFRIEPVGNCLPPDCAHPSSQSAMPSADGKVIVYLTNSSLSPRDGDQQFDVYVARM